MGSSVLRTPLQTLRCGHLIIRPQGLSLPFLVQSSTKAYPDTMLSGGPKLNIAVQVRNLVRGSREAVKVALSSNQGRLDALNNLDDNVMAEGSNRCRDALYGTWCYVAAQFGVD